MTRKATIILVVVAAFGGIGLIAVSSMSATMEDELKSLTYYEVDLDEIEDGLYRGQADTTFVKVKVAVEVKNHKIVRIEILRHDNGFGKKAEGIVWDMIDLNTYDVDAMNGATGSSQVIKSAVSGALAGKPDPR